MKTPQGFPIFCAWWRRSMGGGSRRRRQLMDFFGLSAAEARLARAICHGDSVEEYATDQGLRLPTVRTQLSSIFHKTGTERQATLVRLIAGIPVVRDSA
jgi:DNA-binding CsgD family transcriptional regulator